MSNEKTNTFSFHIVTLIVMCGFLILSIVSALFQGTGLLPITDKQLAYETRTEERTTTFTIEKVIREKNKEDIYCLYLTGVFPSRIELPESTYKEHIGYGNNAFTYSHATLTFYVAASNFGTSFEEAITYTVKRDTFPWESENTGFSDEEVVEFKKALVKSNGQDVYSLLNFDFDTVATGEASGAFLPAAIKKWTERESPKPHSESTTKESTNVEKE